MVDEARKNRLIERIEYILSYLLSNKHDHDINIKFKKARGNNGDTNTTGDIGEKQVLDK